jgi:arsenate reductase (glutaredoxin)
LFRENNIDYEKVNYFVEPVPEDKLRELFRKSGLAPFDFLRKNEPAFRELNLTRETPPDEIIRAIVENPSLLQRPIVEAGERAVLARPVEKVRELLNL